jgi:hypothetical protein
MRSERCNCLHSKCQGGLERNSHLQTTMSTCAALVASSGPCSQRKQEQPAEFTLAHVALRNDGRCARKHMAKGRQDSMRCAMASRMALCVCVCVCVCGRLQQNKSRTKQNQGKVRLCRRSLRRSNPAEARLHAKVASRVEMHHAIWTCIHRDSNDLPKRVSTRAHH